MARRAGTRGPLTVLRQPVRGLIGFGADTWTRIRGHEADVNGAALRMGAQYHYYSSEKAQRELSYKFGSAEAAIDAAWEWFVSHGMVHEKKRRK